MTHTVYTGKCVRRPKHVCSFSSLWCVTACRQCRRRIWLHVAAGRQSTSLDRRAPEDNSQVVQYGVHKLESVGRYNSRDVVYCECE